jgi:tetratricopeptide (TPR) repeat protein
MTQGVLRDADGAELKDDAVIDQRLSDRDDVFFELKGAPVTIKPSAAQVKQAEEEKAKEKAAAGGGTIQIQDESGQPITIHRSELAGMTGAQQLHYTQLAHAREIQTKGQLRKARDIYLQVLATMPTDRNNPLTTSDATLSIKQICNQQLGVLYLHNKFYDLARPHLESAVKIITSSTTGVNGDVVKNIGKVPQVDLATLITMIGQCWFGIGDYIEAQPCFERALKLLTPKGEESKEKKVHAAIEDTKVWLARAMYRGGTSSEKSQALAMFEGIIAKNEHHIAALTYYAQIAIECGKKAEVVPYLLRALVAAQSAGPQTPKVSFTDCDSI